MTYTLNRPDQTYLGCPFLPVADLRRGDIAVFGAGHGTPYPQGTEVSYDTATASSTAPAAIRAAVNQSSTGIDHHDFDLGGPLLGDGGRRLIDCGDLSAVPGDGAVNRAAIFSAVRDVLAAESMPVLLGGDDSVPVPFLAGYEGFGPLHVLQIDAHIDWRDSIGGERLGYSSTMRRASELGFVRSITQVGMRGVGSARPQEVRDALDWGARLITVSDARAAGMDALAGRVPADAPVLIQIDLDALDPSVCPAVNAPTPGGFMFDELAALLRGVAARRPIAGLSVVELVPGRDPYGLSANAAGRLICNLIGTVCRGISPA